MEVEDNRPRKMEVDYSATVDALIPECKDLATNGKVAEAIDKLNVMEKQTRLSADVFSTEKILVAIAQILFQNKQYEELNEAILTLSKKRSQLRPAVTKLVQECCKFVEEVEGEVKMKLIDTLRTVAEGKIYVENERARLTRIVAKVREDEGKVDEAAKMMIELQVETYNTMDRREKVNFILEQMRLCLKNNDNIRAQIISKKVSKKYFEDESTHDLKLEFYQLMIKLDKHEGSYLDICKHYNEVYATPRVKENVNDKVMALKCVALYICLSEFGNEQCDLMNRISLDKELQEEPLSKYLALVKLFLTPEIIYWNSIEQDFGPELKGDRSPLDVFRGEGAEKSWKQLKERVVEHNIRIMSKYYTRVSLTRMCYLLDLEADEVERVVSRLVYSGAVYARIDSLAGILTFQEPRDAAKVLDDWAGNINSLMSLLSHTSHLIDKEVMVHKHANIAPPAASS